jgi:hypothetical protein
MLDQVAEIGGAGGVEAGIQADPAVVLPDPVYCGLSTLPSVSLAKIRPMVALGSPAT